MALQDFLAHFVSAAVAADRRYVGRHDASEIREGIEMPPDHPARRDVELALRAAS